ncbi:SRPBCC family protein [Streptomyces sp. 11x1]|uniref:SRPBCC family protein n=1 Tax=Streptomyces sp. 11x1 TaxID=3038642 RepID=UPI002931298C|nr:SRPBCC domain-containing protein [Streptomyces sp. 11x1]WNZ09745.1 SRPBCC domain-containing protein [Streptomyces sp. 11x1]
MEHEVFVPVPVGRLREALSDPERVARAVPGLQQDAGTPPVAGRLKVRVAGHTITYRGTLRVTPQEDGSYVVEGDAAEVRGSGTVKLTLTLRLVQAGEGTTIACSAAATATGRITDLPPDSVTSATTRLLDRFAENLGAAGPTASEGEAPADQDEHGKPPAPAEEEQPAAPKPADGAKPEADGEPGATADEKPPASGDEKPPASGDEEPPATADEEPPATADEENPPATADEEPPVSAEDEPSASVFETDVPPSALDPFGEGGFVAGDEPPAEAAHARRTMIGRSAEEVDHAPPRGRYAPVPALGAVPASAALRWAVPAAALAVASAIIVSRALRRRR